MRDLAHDGPLTCCHCGHELALVPHRGDVHWGHVVDGVAVDVCPKFAGVAV